MRLHNRAAAAGVRLFAHDVIDSTNAEALRRARDGERAPFWVTARSQSAGRGRRGRDWISEPGNLYASLLLEAPSSPDSAPQLSFVAALAVHDAACGLTGWTARVSLKWPNDLLCAGAKLGGILVEGEGPFVVIGIGTNCAHHPHHTRYPSTDLSACGVVVSPEEFYEPLSVRMLERLAQWNRGAGFLSIRHDWLARAYGLGEEIRVSAGNRERSGIFEGLDEAGRLILRLPDGKLEAIAAGEVFPVKQSAVGFQTNGAFGPPSELLNMPGARAPRDG